jgi:hypothetical protein
MLASVGEQSKQLLVQIGLRGVGPVTETHVAPVTVVSVFLAEVSE